MYIGSTNVFRVQNSEHVYNYIVQTISLTKAGMVTAKERALAWGREIQEASSRAQRELERDEEELAELEILFAAAGLKRPPLGADKNVADADGWKKVRRKVQRCEGGPNKSTMAGYVNYGDEKTYLFNFRMTRVQLEHASDKLAAAGFLKDSMHSAHTLRVSGRFKFATCCYVLAFGGSAGSYFKFAADVAGLGQSTVDVWMHEFTNGIMKVLGADYLYNISPDACHIQACRDAFAARRGFPSVAQAVDGTHVPFNPISCYNKYLYKNYKGWFSLHVLAYVNSFHLFTNMSVGGTGRTSDVTALKKCPFFAKITAHRTEWLGKDGYILGDGGTTDPQGIVLTPIHMPRTVQDKWFNFCHSSTRFFVEETFGRWKNRLRTLSLPPYLSLSLSVFPSVCLPPARLQKRRLKRRSCLSLSLSLSRSLSLSLFLGR